jgi:hypothetical protein
MEFDGYRLEEKLHTGGMAALWRVTDLRQRHVGKPGLENGVPPLIMKVPLLFLLTTRPPSSRLKSNR